MKPLTLADVSLPEGRICFYYLFDPVNPQYAAKRNINGQISSLKTPDLDELFAWIGFDALAQALYQSTPMQKRFKIRQTRINEHLLLISCNLNHTFFIQQHQQWAWSKDPNDLIPVFGEQIFTDIENIAGKGFVAQQIQQLKQDQAMDQQLSSTLNEVRASKQKIASLQTEMQSTIAG